MRSHRTGRGEEETWGREPAPRELARVHGKSLGSGYYLGDRRERLEVTKEPEADVEAPPKERSGQSVVEGAA